MKQQVSFWVRLGIMGCVVALTVMGSMVGTAQAVANAVCEEPTASCTFVTAPGKTGVACGLPTDGPSQDWFCDFGDSAVGVVVGGDCFFGESGAFRDVILGSEFDDTIDAGQDEDIVCAGDGNDVVEGGEGDDALYGKAGNDVLSGGNGNDSIVGGLGDDALLGGADNDSLNGGLGDDRCIGGDGVDAMFCETVARAGTAGR